MWSGKTVSLAGHQVTDGEAEIRVHPISYNEWIACYDPRYAQAFEDADLPKPYAGIGVSVLIESQDRLIPLTRRGIATPVYPGRLYSPGGGPKPGQTSVEAILEEILEETGLRNGEHFDDLDLFMMAFVADTNFAGSRHSRPELVAGLPARVGYRDIEAIQQERLRKKGTKETDVWGLEPVSSSPASLAQFIKLHGGEMCPPTEAALTWELYSIWEREVGPEKAFAEVADFVGEVGRYQREKFRVPILLLGD